MAFVQSILLLDTVTFPSNPPAVLNTSIVTIDVINIAGPPPFQVVATLSNGGAVRAEFATLALAKAFFEGTP
jgi:hypothetical protein